MAQRIEGTAFARIEKFEDNKSEQVWELFCDMFMRAVVSADGETAWKLVSGARVACAGTGTPQGNMAAWNTSDLDIMLSVPWNTSDLDTMLAFDHQIHGVEHAIEKFARRVKQHWSLHPGSHPFTGNFAYNKMR